MFISTGKFKPQMFKVGFFSLDVTSTFKGQSFLYLSCHTSTSDGITASKFAIITRYGHMVIQDYVHPDDHTYPTYEIPPGMKPFTVITTLFTTNRTQNFSKKLLKHS